VFASLIARASGGQESVELVQIGRRDVNVAGGRRLSGRVQGRRGRRIGRAAPHPHEDRFHIEAGAGAARRDGPLDHLDRVVGEQLQHANVMLRAAMRSVLRVQSGP
jgi:hypothetical protein